MSVRTRIRRVVPRAVLSRVKGWAGRTPSPAPAHPAPPPLFDAAFYLESYPDVGRSGLDPYRHYDDCGGDEGRWPNALFDPIYYRRQIGPDGFCGPKTALLHYLIWGSDAGLSPHPLFDPEHYQRQVGPGGFGGKTALGHYLTDGAAAGLSPHPLFDPEHYQRQVGPGGFGGVPALAHFVRHGAAAGLIPHPSFEASYADQLRHLGASYADQLRHLGDTSPLDPGQQARLVAAAVWVRRAARS